MGSPDPHPVETHEPTILNCGEIDSIPPTIYTWRLEDLDIDVNADHAIKGRDGLLYLQDPQGSETFICTADNNLARESHTGYIRVMVEGELCRYVHVHAHSDGTSSNHSLPPLSFSSSGSGSNFPRRMMATPQNVTANVGDTISFQCIVGGRYMYMYAYVHAQSPDQTSGMNVLLCAIIGS